MTEESEDDPPEAFDSDEAAAIYSIHRAIAKWQKYRGCLSRFHIPPAKPVGSALLLRSANEALSSYALRAEVRRLQDGRTLIRIVIKDRQGLPET